MHAELQSIVTQAQDRAAHLRLAQTFSAFLSRLRSSAKTLDVLERQRIVRLLVKEILVGDDAIIIRHSIPITPSGPDDGTSKSDKSGYSNDKSYLLRSGRNGRTLRDASPLVPGLGRAVPIECRRRRKRATFKSRTERGNPVE
jgi:site-specific DNA recombinase